MAGKIPRNIEDIKRSKEHVINNLVGIKFEGRVIPNFNENYKLEERMKDLNVPGIGINLINNFHTEWEYYLGAQDLKSNIKVTNKTIFEAASTTKVFTTILALHLLEKGLLKLDENVNSYLKKWKIPENEFTKKEKVTLLRLLTHMAGINRPNSLFGVELDKKPTLIQVLNGKSPAINDPVKVEFIPGTKHQYSNLAFSIIQKLLEDVTGKTYIQLIKEIIFKPLSMNDSTVEFPLPTQFANRAVLPHTGEGEVKEKSLHPTAFGHGNLSCSPNDMSKFILEILASYNGRSEKIISKKMVLQMLTSQKSFGSIELMGFSDQALGVFLLKGEKNFFFIHPGGNEPGTNCFMLASPITGQGAVIMTNGAKGDLLSLQILYRMATEYNWGILKE